MESQNSYVIKGIYMYKLQIVAAVVGGIIFMDFYLLVIFFMCLLLAGVMALLLHLKNKTLHKDVTNCESELRELAMSNNSFESNECINKRKIENYNCKLSSQSLQLYVLNESLSEICLDVMRHMDGSFNKRIPKSISSKLRRSKQIINSWNSLSMHFIDVSIKFYRDLIERLPTLTEREHRHCGYMISGMSIRQVSSAIGVSKESVKMARYRIHNKISEAGFDNLEMLLSDYSNEDQRTLDDEQLIPIVNASTCKSRMINTPSIMSL